MPLIYFKNSQAIGHIDALSLKAEALLGPLILQPSYSLARKSIGEGLMSLANYRLEANRSRGLNGTARVQGLRASWNDFPW